MNLDDLIALNDEMAALTRSGVPLGPALQTNSREVTGALQSVMAAVGQRLESGESLDSVVANHPSLPPLYAAVVAAGARSGRLTAALEGLAVSLRRLADLRRAVGGALFYPFVVVCLAIFLFVGVVSRIATPLDDALTAHRVRVEGGWLEGWLYFVNHYSIVLIVIPIVGTLLYWFWMWFTNQATILRLSRISRAFAWLPGTGRLVRLSQMASFSNLLSLLIRQGIPIKEAVLLAANAADGADLRADAERLHEHISRGSSESWQGTAGTGLPTLIGWMLTGELTAADLSNSLERMSESYERQAEQLANWLRLIVPAAATLVLAGSVTVAYASSTVIPWLNVLIRIGHSTG